LKDNHRLIDRRLKQGRELETQLVSDLKTAKIERADQQHNERLRKQLELIRVSHGDDRNQNFLGVTGPTVNFDSTNERYQSAFAEAGLDFESLSDQQPQDTFHNSPIRETLIAASDHWIRAIPTAGAKTRVQARYAIGDWSGAAAIGREAIESDPSDAFSWLLLAPALVLSDAKEDYLTLSKDNCFFVLLTCLLFSAPASAAVGFSTDESIESIVAGKFQGGSIPSRVSM
jgi:hypothetical protein